MKALLLENIHPEATRVLADAGYEVEQVPGALSGSALIAKLDGVDLVGIRSRTTFTAEVIEKMPDSVKAIGAFCIGTNQIDLDAALLAGVPVFNAPYSNTRSVVELAIGEIIAMARKLCSNNADMHAGVWNKSANGSHEVRGRTLGIVGYGSIGSQLSILAEAMGMKVYFYDIVDRLALGNARRCSSLEELLIKAETVSLHVDGRPENTGFFGAREFAMMRPRSLFLNLSRGKVVDTDALAQALESGHLAGAAVDVFPTEPKSNNNPDDPFESPLRGLDNVILTPHVGGSTQEAQFDIGGFVASKLANYVETGSTETSVNFPEVHLTTRENAWRILHLHNNVPGALADLNNVFARHGANIVSQTLSTRGQLGYVITDVAAVSDGLIDEIASLDETVKVRVVKL